MMKQESRSGFPKGFLVGASTAAHQVEGDNVHSDFWALEQLAHSSFTEPSLAAVDHYYRYLEDLSLMEEAGMNCYRFSLEWARIEPIAGVFDASEIDHYRRMILACREKGIEPIVTLHHFSSPKWLIAQGGFESALWVGHFIQYVEYVIKNLGSIMTYVCTINEANMGLQIAAIVRERMKTMSVQTGFQLPKAYLVAMEEAKRAFGGTEVQHFLSMRTIQGNNYIMQAHVQARTMIKAFAPHIKVGITLSLHDFQALPGGEAFAAQAWEEEFTQYLPHLQADDFLGVQNYTRKRVGPNGVCEPDSQAERTQMGYEFYPEALENVIRKVHEALSLPLIVTENGIATTSDERRVAFIDRALAGVSRCLADHIPVLGYCHWSLLDNFEWMMGYLPKFGLIAVDRNTMERHPKPSLRHLGGFSGKERQ